MSDLVLVGLIVAVAVLWRRVEALSDRLHALDFAPATPRAWVPEPVAAPDPVSAPAPVQIPVWAAPSPTSAPPPDITEPVLAEPISEPEPVASEPATFGFEELFGHRLPVWAGGVTLAVAGSLIVRWSIDVGLLSPLVRVILGFAFGVGLIAGGEAALRREDLVRDPRVAQALGGAGVATLYASILVAGNLYGLISPGLAFAGMTAVTALAGGLAFSFGAPTAVLGLIGGLAAPALTGAGQANVPLLSAYLTLTAGGLCTLGRARGWLWLGVTAIAGGFGWGLFLILGGALDAAASLSVGLFTLLLAVGLPVALFGDHGAAVRFGAGLAGCAQLAALVATGGFAPLDWALFGLLSVAAVWLSRREEALRPLAPAALAVALLLLAAWPAPSLAMLATVLAGAAAIHAGSAARDLWRERGRAADAARIAAVALAVPALPLLHFQPAPGFLALLALLGAAPVAAFAALGWRRGDDPRFAVLAGAAAALLTVAGVAVAPDWLDAPWAALVTGALLLLGHAARDERVEPVAWAFAIAALSWLVVSGFAGPDAERAFGVDHGLSAARAVTWIVPALVAALFAWRGCIAPAAAIAQVAAVLLAYVAASQVAPAAALPVVPALLLVGVSFRPRTSPARAAAAALASCWTAEPLLAWTAGGTGALFGEPLLVTALPASADVVLRIALPALALLAATRDPGGLRRPAAVVAGVLGLVVAHTLYKQIFALASSADFVALGLAERTVWQAALALLALGLPDRARIAALALVAASLAHFGWFTLVLHNPLWSEQAVGAWPIANLLFPAYGLALLLLHAASREALSPPLARARHWAVMAVVLLFSASTVRQLAHGSLLTGGNLGDPESIAYSLTGVALAIGFLRHGIARGERDWRIVSLILMLAAVAKVFLHDAAGLDGLARIISFAGLGFSLLGLGWLYSRFLPEPAR